MRQTAFVLLCLLAACARTPHYSPLPTVPAVCAPVGDSFSVVTFNTALAPGINEMASLRAPEVAAAAVREFADDDLVCLEEVWRPEDAASIIAAFGRPANQVLTSDTRGHNESGEDRCASGALDGLEECVRDKCPRTSAEDTTICAVVACRPALLKLYIFDRPCFNCAAASVGHPAAEIRATCTGKGASRFYHGSNGVIMLSRHPLTNPETVELPSSSANRIVLMATMNLPDGRQIEVGCTHLSSRQYGQPTNPMFADWGDELRTQLVIAAERLRNRAENRPIILAGDMNFGPDGPGLEGQDTAVWDYAHVLGYSSPAAAAKPPFCTLCPDNTLYGKRSGQLIDHVLFRNRTGGPELEALCVERLMDKTVRLGGPESHVVSSLSDHYAVRARFRFLDR